MGPGALRSGWTLAPAPGLPPGSGRNRGAGGRGGVGGRDPRELQRGGEPGSEGEGEGGGAEETLLQHGVSSPRGGCKHGTRAPFQGSPLKGQRLRRDLDSAAAFITSGAGAAPRAGRRAGPGSCRDSGGVASLPASRRPDGASAAAWQGRHLECPRRSGSVYFEGPALVTFRFAHLENGITLIFRRMCFLSDVDKTVSQGRCECSKAPIVPVVLNSCPNPQNYVPYL